MDEPAWTTLSDSDLEMLFRGAQSEVSRRATLSTAIAAQEELNQSVLSAKGIVRGQEWEQPTGAHDAYPKGWEVTRDGKTWVSTTSGNVWAPGASGWREKQASETPVPEFVQPTGAHDAYNLGELVTFAGKVWKSTINANVWSPDSYPAGWQVQPGAAKGARKP